jgi:bla regulator protein BlaR1
MDNVSSEQELQELRRDGKITEDEYKELLDAMRKSLPSESQSQRNITGKYMLWLGLAAVVIAGVLFFTSVTSNVDKIDYPFVNDPEIIGTWKSVDFVQAIDDFKAVEKHWAGDLYLKNMFFFDEGRTGGPWRWTEGLIIHPGDKTAAKYHIKEFDGEKYMFFEWKSGDYTIRRMQPRYYVLKKVPETE